MQYIVKADRNAVSPCTFELQAQASSLTDVHACVHVNMVPAIPKQTLMVVILATRVMLIV